jgi:hypothetical protein
MVRFTFLFLILLAMQASANSFGSGALLEGDTNINATRAAIVFEPNSEAEIKLRATDAQFEAWAEFWTYTEDPTGQVIIPYASPAINERSGTGSIDAIGVASKWASITLTGGATANLTGSTMIVHDPPATREGAVPWAGAPAWVTSQSNAWADWAGVRVDGTRVTFSLAIPENATVELTGWHWTCAVACPPNTDATTTEHAGGAVTLVNFTRIQGVSLEVTARIASLVIGGEMIDLQHAGFARFPIASIENVDNFPNASRQTIETKGNISMQEIHWADDVGQLQFRALQASGLARVDEDAPISVGSQTIKIAAAVAGAFVIGLLVSKQLLAEPMLHPERQRICQVVQSNSGLSFREIQRNLGLGNGQLHYHLFILTKSGQLNSRDVGVNKIFIAPGEQKIIPEWALILRKKGMQEIYLLCSKLDGVPRRGVLKELVAELAVARSTIRHRLHRLEDSGLISFQGSNMILQVRDSGLDQGE